MSTNFPPTVSFQLLSNISFNKSLPLFLLSGQPFTKLLTIHSLLKALFHLISLLLLMTPRQTFVTSRRPCRIVISKDYASTHYLTSTKARFHLLACRRRCPAEDWRLARVLRIASLNRKRNFKKPCNLDPPFQPSLVRRVSRYLWAMLAQVLPGQV